MSDTPSVGTVLYFDNDLEHAEQTVRFLQSEGYRVEHFTGLDGMGLDAVRDRLPEPPDAVLLDFQGAGDDLEVCAALRADYLSEATPIIITAANLDQESVFAAYDAGATDYLNKPLRFKELGAKMSQYRAVAEQRASLNQQIAMARNLAFTAMTTSSELGEILRFHEYSLSISDFKELGSVLLETLSGFGVKGSIIFFLGREVFCSDDGTDRPLEREVLRKFRDQGRLVSFKNRTFFNYSKFSLLIRNMPVDNEERYGILKDQLCIMLNGLEGRVRAMLIERSNEDKKRAILIIANTIGRMVMDMEENNVKLSQQFEKVIVDMETRLSHDILKYNLLEHEERAIMDNVYQALGESTSIFERSIALESEYRKIMKQLLESLAAKQPLDV
jgi:DNA-binding response OmpR family regulator